MDGGDVTPVGATIADHIASQNLVAGRPGGPARPRERTGRGQHVEASLLGGQIWAQASEYTACLLSGSPAGRSNRSHPLVPGLYGIFPTADGWLAIVGVVGPARDVFYRTIGRPDLIERFPQLLYFGPEKAELWPLLDAVFASRTTAEWCARLGAAGLRFAPVRDHASVVADPAVWENGYLSLVDDPSAPGSQVSVVGTAASGPGCPRRTVRRDLLPRPRQCFLGVSQGPPGRDRAPLQPPQLPSRGPSDLTSLSDLISLSDLTSPNDLTSPSDLTSSAVPAVLPPARSPVS